MLVSKLFQSENKKKVLLSKIEKLLNKNMDYLMAQFGSDEIV